MLERSLKLRRIFDDFLIINVDSINLYVRMFNKHKIKYMMIEIHS